MGETPKPVIDDPTVIAIPMGNMNLFPDTITSGKHSNKITTIKRIKR